MKMLRMKMVSPANIRLTVPTPMSPSTLAASPALLGSFAASSSSLVVMSYLSLRSLRVLFFWTKSSTSSA